MIENLPALNAIRAFEAAARCSGFQAAGIELGVSANAVGAHIKGLEAWLGVKLFHRTGRGVALTEIGKDYFADVSPILRQLGLATKRVRRKGKPTSLSISAMPSFASTWLIPKLASIVEACSGFDIKIVSSIALTDFAAEDVDAAIRLGRGTYPGLQSMLLFEEQFFPVCSPRLLGEGEECSGTAILEQHVLLHDAYEARIPEQMNWQRWLTAAGMEHIDGSCGPRLAYSHMSLQAAIDGTGIALASSVLASGYLSNGSLIRCCGDLAVKGPYAFHLVAPERSWDSPPVAAFRDWISRYPTDRED